MHFRAQRSKNTEQIRILFILLGGSLICETSFNYLSVSYYYDFFIKDGVASNLSNYHH